MIPVGFLRDQEYTEYQYSDEDDKDDEDDKEDDQEDDCHHSFILKDDIGYVCRVCGLVQKKIQEMFEFFYPKVMTNFLMFSSLHAFMLDITK